MINRFLNYGNNKNIKTSNAQNITKNNIRRKKVYADTATGGWY